jgi:uncharacterized membrane protein YbhN (UPF0104 family)
MSSWAVADAVVLAVRSDLMLGAAVASVGAATAVGATLRRRALVPGLSWWEAAVSSAHPEAVDLKGARWAATLVTAAVLGLVGAGLLAGSGHPPAPAVTVLLVGAAAAAAALVAVRQCRQGPTRAVLARRGVRLMASSLFVEISAATAMVVSVAVVTHTEGLSAVSLVEVAAITVTTRLAVSLTPWPGGLGVADAVMLVPLMWIGLPIHVALAAVLVWRAGSLIAATTTVIVARRTTPAHGRPGSPDSADGGRILHRSLFAGLGLLPRRVRAFSRRLLFDALFSLSADPWGYESTAYEQRKREHLLAAVPQDATTVLEVGCADGHNLEALARRHPHMRVLGTDVSPAAVGIATDRTRALGTVTVLTSEEFPRDPAVAPDGIDCVILSEVLYYLGSEKAMREALAPVRDRMSSGCRVVLLHGCSDAPALHARAMSALGVSADSEVQIDDPERPFTVCTARRRY